jgi:hypothetical protein
VSAASKSVGSSLAGGTHAYGSEEDEASNGRIIAILLVIAVSFRLALLPFFEGYVLDQTSRTLSVAAWNDGPYPFLGTQIWPDGNYLLAWLGLFLGESLYWSSRWIGLLAALTNVPLIYLLTRREYGHFAGVLAGLAIALSPFHAVVSMNGPTSEPSYISAVLLGLVALQRFVATEQAKYLMFAGLAVGLATTFRFDGVLWGPLFALGASLTPSRTTTRMNLRRIATIWALIGIASSLYPALLVYSWWSKWGDPIWVFTVAQGNAEQFFANGHPRYGRIFYNLFATGFWQASAIFALGPIVAMVAFVGMLKSVIQRRSVPIIVGYVGISAWLAYATVTHAILAQWRYALILHVLLTVFVGSGLNLFRIRNRSRAMTLFAVGWAAGTLLVVAVPAYFSFNERGVITRQLSAVSPIQPYPYAGLRVLDWVEKNASVEKPAMVLPCVQGNIVLSLEGQPLKERKVLEDVMIFQPGGIGRTYTRDELIGIFKAKVAKPAYVLVARECAGVGFRDGAAPDIVIPPTNDDVPFDQQGLRFTPRNSDGNLRIYEVAPVETQSMEIRSSR